MTRQESPVSPERPPPKTHSFIPSLPSTLMSAMHSPENMAVTSNVFPLRLNGLKEAKCPRLRSIFSTHRCQNTSSGGCAGEERRGEDLQIGPRNGAANQRKLDVFHLTHNALAQPEPRMHGRLPILSLQSKNLQTLLVSAVWWEFRICFDNSKKKNAGVSPQLTLPVVVIAEKFQLGRALSSSQTLVCFLFMCLIEMMQEEKQTW